MAEQPGDLDALREVKAKRQADLSRIQASLEEPADKVYSFNVSVKGITRPLRFRRWTHEQANRTLALPFAHKFHQERVVLSPEEAVKLLAVQTEMVRDALVEKEVWDPFLSEPENASAVARIWNVIAMMSGHAKQYDEALRDFFETDRGQAYGMFWFVSQGRMPSEISSLPDTDVKAANVFLQIWGRKMDEKK